MIRNGFLSFFSFENDSEQNFEVFLILKWFGTEFCGFFSSEKRFGMELQGFFSSEKWFGTKFQEFSPPRNGLERNFEGFSLPRNGLELNSEVFLFCETGEIPTELPSVPSCPAFRGIIFCQEMATLIHGES